MNVQRLHPWNVSIDDARELQRTLRERLVLEPPADFSPQLVTGADLSIRWKSDRGYAALVTIEAGSLETLEEATAAVDVEFPYVPGFLSFRELPPLAAAWERLRRRPDAVIFDGQGIAHPRRFGLACHGGLLFDVPSVGCAKSLLVGTHGPLGEERGSTAEVVVGDEVVGMAVRMRDRVKPVYVSPGHRMDLPTAVELVLSMGAGYREPETTRRSHRLANEARKNGEAKRRER